MDELNIRLIDLVESEPCIYDKTDVFYSNKDHVKQVWEKISNAMQLSVPVCQKRWRYLRDYFVRQLHMSKTDNKKSYWALFERMLFLAPFSTRKARVNTTSSECCTTTSMIPGHNITTKKRRQRSTSAIIKKNWDNDQNSNILSVSSSSSNAGLDEFNSFDYLNLYQAQFGFADNAALLQLQKQTNFPLNLDDRLSSLPLEIQIRSPSSEPNNSTINFSKRSSNNTGSINDDFDFATNYTNPTALLSVESHYSNSEKSPNPNSMQNDDDLKFYNNNNSNNTTTVNINNNHRYHNSRFNSIEYNKKNLITNDTEDLRKIDYKNNSTKISPKMKRSTTRKRKKTDILNELLDILKKSENTNCDEHDYFFRSLLNSVRRIDENLIIPFPDDYDDEEDVVIIDTGESNWRQKLKRY
ncbi:putative uncharacterized protein DDB_G0282133 [Condylostylus longicornis]|uniref:putative uncharacterized protein DDB_G0282133 n=1 Tax=Condylostylus longicornis TaxID=2530218 RepID=UPI00244DBE14|nr:putative uncharacterized protein DDB_G0282133 [Condylostylus longicornis]